MYTLKRIWNGILFGTVSDFDGTTCYSLPFVHEIVSHVQVLTLSNLRKMIHHTEKFVNPPN